MKSTFTGSETWEELNFDLFGSFLVLIGHYMLINVLSKAAFSGKIN